MCNHSIAHYKKNLLSEGERLVFVQANMTLHPDCVIYWLQTRDPC